MFFIPHTRANYVQVLGMLVVERGGRQVGEGITGLGSWSSQGWLGLHQVAYTFWTAVSILTSLHYIGTATSQKHKCH